MVILHNFFKFFGVPPFMEPPQYKFYETRLPASHRWSILLPGRQLPIGVAEIQVQWGQLPYSYPSPKNHFTLVFCMFYNKEIFWGMNGTWVTWPVPKVVLSSFDVYKDSRELGLINMMCCQLAKRFPWAVHVYFCNPQGSGSMFH